VFVSYVLTLYQQYLRFEFSTHRDRDRDRDLSRSIRSDLDEFRVHGYVKYPDRLV